MHVDMKVGLVMATVMMVRMVYILIVIRLIVIMEIVKMIVVFAMGTILQVRVPVIAVVS